MNEIKTVLDCWPAVLVVLVLNGLGMGIKKATSVDNKWIPLILPVVGAVVYTFAGPAQPLPGMDKVADPRIIYCLVGFLCGCVAVWGHSFMTNLFTGANDQTPTKPTP